jgi:hypothetical protein
VAVVESALASWQGRERLQGRERKKKAQGERKLKRTPRDTALRVRESEDALLTTSTFLSVCMTSELRAALQGARLFGARCLAWSQLKVMREEEPAEVAVSTGRTSRVRSARRMKAMGFVDLRRQ